MKDLTFVYGSIFLVITFQVAGCRANEDLERVELLPSTHASESEFILTRQDAIPETLSIENWAPDTTQHLIVTFWARWCPPCLDQIAILDSIYLELGERGWQTASFLYSPSFVEDSTEIIQQGTSSFLVAPANGEIASQFGGVYGLPTTFILDRELGVFFRVVGIIEADQIFELLTDPHRFERADTLYRRFDAP